MQTPAPIDEIPAAKPVAAVAFALAAALFLSMGRAAIDPDSGGELDGDTIAVAAFATSAAVCCLALCGAFAKRAPLRDTLALHSPRASLATLLVYAGGLLGLSILTKLALVSSGAYQGSGLETLDAAISPEGAAAAMTLVLAAALAPGFAEELLFRGLLLGSLAPRAGPGVAVLVSALLFGAFHVDPIHVAGAIPLGLYLGVVRVVTGSTLAAAFCHIANNGVAIALMADTGAFSGAIGLAGTLCLVPAVIWMLRGWRGGAAEPLAAPPPGE